MYLNANNAFQSVQGPFESEGDSEGESGRELRGGLGRTPVVSTVLRWTDAETQESLTVRMQGSREFLDELVMLGFEVVTEVATEQVPGPHDACGSGTEEWSSVGELGDRAHTGPISPGALGPACSDPAKSDPASFDESIGTLPTTHTFYARRSTPENPE